MVAAGEEFADGEAAFFAVVEGAFVDVHADELIGEFGIEARREEGYTGVWVDCPAGPEKIAAIGVRVSAGGVSMHGTALNVTTDLSYFGGIIPCGIPDRPVTSMQRLLGSATPGMEPTSRRTPSPCVVLDRPPGS